MTQFHYALCILCTFPTANEIILLHHLDNEVDGESFMDLSESDLKEMIPNKMGVVKKILKLQQEVGLVCIQYNYNYSRLHCYDMYLIFSVFCNT